MLRNVQKLSRSIEPQPQENKNKNKNNRLQLGPCVEVCLAHIFAVDRTSTCQIWLRIQSTVYIYICIFIYIHIIADQSSFKPALAKQPPLSPPVERLE